jgi:hypothetical protein
MAEEEGPPPSPTDRLISALSDIAYQIERVADTLDNLWERLDEITPETNRGLRYLRTLDYGRD